MGDEQIPDDDPDIDVSDRAMPPLAVGGQGDAPVSSEDEAPIASDPPPRPERGNHSVAALLAMAAIVAALIAARASFVGGDASGRWQTALRADVKRSAAVLENARYLYQTELPLALTVIEARIRQQQLQAAQLGQPADVQQALQIEESIQAARVGAFGPSSDLATSATYALPSGGVDLGRRLADMRAVNADPAAADPDVLEAQGDVLASEALRLTFSAVAIAICVLLGALAQPFPRWRRQLVVGGAIALVVGIVAALSVELLG